MQISFGLLLILFAIAGCIYVGNVDRICWNTTAFETDRRYILVKRLRVSEAVVLLNGVIPLYRDARVCGGKGPHIRAHSRGVTVLFRARKDGKEQRVKLEDLGYPNDFKLYYFKSEDGTSFLFRCDGLNLDKIVQILLIYGFSTFHEAVSVLSWRDWDVVEKGEKCPSFLLQIPYYTEKHSGVGEAICEAEKASGAGILKHVSARLWALVIVTCALYLVIHFVSANVRIAVVDGDSMLPTYHDGEVLWGRIVRTERDLAKWKYPCCVVRLKDGNLVIKRLVGVPGDVVELKDGDTYVNGRLVLERQTSSWDNMSFDLGEGDYLFLGDNRSDSYDGRFWPGSFVSLEDIFFVIWDSGLREVGA